MNDFFGKGLPSFEFSRFAKINSKIQRCCSIALTASVLPSENDHLSLYPLSSSAKIVTTV